MKDCFDREITYLRLSVTDRCNLRCRYCMPGEGVCLKSHGDMLSEDEMIRAVEIAAGLGVSKLKITGGEPLLKKNILSICGRIAEISAIKDLSMTSNGTRLSAFAAELKRAGVRRLNISLDTLKEDRYRYMSRTGELCEALRGIESALAAGFDKIKINTVLIGGFNDDEIKDLATLTLRYPVDLRFIELMPMLDKAFGREAFVPADIVKRELPEAEELSGLDGVARLLRLPGAFGNIGLISPVSMSFCGSCGRLRLTADGRLKPCLHSSLEFGIKGLSDEAVTEQFRKAVLAKPLCHKELSFESPSGAAEAMSGIGG